MHRILASLLLCMPVAAAAMTLEDLARLSSVGEMAVADNGNIAWVRSQPRELFTDDDGPAWNEIYLMANQAGPRRYVSEIDASDLKFSPDGEYLFFLAKRGVKGDQGEDDATRALWRIAVGGGEAEIACATETDIGNYALHPDGKQLLLSAPQAATADDEILEQSGFKVVVYEEDIKPPMLWTAHLGAEGGCKPAPMDLEGVVHAMDYGPDGSRILISVAPTGLVDDRYMQTRMRIVDGDGQTMTAIANLGKLGTAQFSPDGRRVGFIGVNDFNDPGPGRLKVADAATGDIRTLLGQDLKGHVRDLAWHDETHILAVVHQGVEAAVWRVDVTDGSHQVLHDQGNLIPEQIVHQNGRTVVQAHAPSHPAELFEVSHEDGQMTRLTNSNPWLDDIELARQTTLDYQASDGLDLQGVLIWPGDYREGKRYPLVIFVHGGPEAHRSDGWLTNYSNPAQVFATHGYFSFYPNYRGSTGKGVAFSKADQHAYATPEFDDIVDGKNALVEQGLVDNDRVGITGGSYGGYATAWSATALTEHYAAGVMFVGIANQISKFGTTDIAREMHAVHSRAWPWEDWDFMLERSPIYHAKGASTPLLIMHGDSDPRVHPSQSMEMYRYLKLAGDAPVRLVLYPDEQHGNEKAAARYDYSRRLLRWMNHYLQGNGGEPPAYEVDYGDFLKELEAEDHGDNSS